MNLFILTDGARYVSSLEDWPKLISCDDPKDALLLTETNARAWEEKAEACGVSIYAFLAPANFKLLPCEPLYWVAFLPYD